MFSSSGKYVAVASEDSRTHVFSSKSEKSIQSIASYRNQVRCCGISEPFGIVVSGTDDGLLLVSSITSGQTEFTLELNGLVPEKIVITPSWGFILVFGKRVYPTGNQYFLSLFTLNGIFVKQTRISNEIVFWKCFINPELFDYIAIVTSKNEVFFFEVYFLNIGQPIFKSSEPIRAVYFSFQYDFFIYVADSGSVLLISNSQFSSII